MGQDNFSCDNSGNRVCDPSVADPVAASGITTALATAGNDYTETLVGGKAYIVTVVIAAATVLASATNVTSTAANIEWVWVAGKEYIFRMPLGKTTLYLESNVNTSVVYFRELA